MEIKLNAYPKDTNFGKYSVLDYHHNTSLFLHPEGWHMHPFWYDSKEKAQNAIDIQSCVNRIKEDLNRRGE